MARNNTGNPIGSDEFLDFQDNVKNLDVAVNAQEPSWPDRFGRDRKTWHGMEQDFQQFLIDSGYVNIGDYGPELEITARNQIFWRDGELYRPGAVLELPYTTTGDWATEEELFVAVGDAALRQDLSMSTPGNGSWLVATQLPLDGSVSMTQHDKNMLSIDALDFGAVGNGIVDDTLALQALFNAADQLGGAEITLTPGRKYLVSHTIFYHSNTIFNGRGSEIYFESNTNNGSLFMPITFQDDEAWTENVTFENFWISTHETGGNGISICRARRILLRNINSHYMFWHMIDGAGGRECIVENCYSANCETSPFQMDAASYEFAAEASDAAGNRLPIVFADPNTSGWSNSRDFIIRDCRVVGAKYAAVHLHNTNNQNVLIQGCTFESCFTGVYSDEECTQVNVNIDNCFFINNVVDVQGLSDHYGMTIKGCLFYGTAYVTDHYYGIRIPTLNQVTNQRVGVQVIGNRFVGKPRPVIIEDMNNVYINDNIFDRCGIEFAASENEVVSSNPAALVRIAGCNQAYIQSNAFTDCQIATIISSDPTVLIEMPSWIIISDNVSRRSSACMISTRSTNKMIVKGNINGNGPQPDFINYFFGDSRSGTIEGCRVNTSSGHGIRLNGGIFNIVKHNYFESPVDTNYAIQIIGSEGCITDHNVVQSGFISDRNMMATGSSFVECDEPFITLMYESPAIVRYIDHTFVEL